MTHLFSDYVIILKHFAVTFIFWLAFPVFDLPILANPLYSGFLQYSGVGIGDVAGFYPVSPLHWSTSAPAHVP